MSKVVMRDWPDVVDWLEVKRRALVTAGFSKVKTPPDIAWKCSLLKAKHSPIRWLRFSFDIECPSWVSVHLCRHVHAQPYVRSQRNDRQDKYDRNAARQDEPVRMIWDMNAEELINIANKRLCFLASKETREVVKMMCDQVKEKCPEFAWVLVPNCFREHGCNEMYSCGYYNHTHPDNEEDDLK